MSIAVAASAVALWGAVGRTMDAPSQPRAGLLLDVHDEGGNPLPARVRIEERGAQGRLGAVLRPRARSRTVRGRARVDLEPGEYRVWITHGPRHRIEHFDASISVGGVVRRDVTLQELVPLPEHSCVDLHVHSNLSEDAHEGGGVDNEALAAEGLDLSITTDHNQANTTPGVLPSLRGVEVTSWAPEFGHFNAFPVVAVPRYKRTSPHQLFRALRSQGAGFVQINHPRLDDHIAYFKLGGLHRARFADAAFTVDGADGVEVFNGYDIARPDRVLEVLHDVTQLQQAGHHLTMTGGSDSHGAPGHVPGYPRTCVRTRDVAKLAETLREGDAFLSNGPVLDLSVEGQRPGARVQPHADGRVAVRVEVRVHPEMRLDTVEIWAGSSCVWRTAWAPPASGAPFVVSTRVATHGARTLHARVQGGKGLSPFVERRDVTPLAFTNPVYLQVPHARSAHDE